MGVVRNVSYIAFAFLKGEQQRKYRLTLYERAIKILQNDICVTEIRQFHSRDFKLQRSNL